jgi:hypothetical protein
MFNVITILITYFLDKHGLLDKIRLQSNKFFLNYIKFFIKQDFINQRHIRYTYLYTTLPIIISLTLINMIIVKVFFIKYLLSMFVFIITVDMLRWQFESKNNKSDYVAIIAYATKFFVPVFWFILLPYGIGSTCYLIIIILSIELKNKIADSVVYNTVVDKMLFYINVVPYFLLFFFIAIASNFENISHHILSKIKNLNKSFYSLNNLLTEIILIATDDSNFKNSVDNDNLADSGLDTIDNMQIHVDEYVKALLYRAGIFFIGTYSIIQFFRFIEFLVN